MDVSASALQAERVRAEVVAANMANAETTRTADGGPYRRQHVVFAAQQQTFAGAMMQAGGASGIHDAAFGMGGTRDGGVAVTGVIEDRSAPLMRYEPGHPDADKDGYVAYPDINPLTEMVDLMGATRAYGMNASALQAEKMMIGSSLEILK